jgi:fructose-1,6-bisphosphatase/inositol monophosphatase family enzyme
VSISPVSTLLREAAGRFILPRFRHPDLQGVREKTPGDLVTLADTETEAFLLPRLSTLFPGARCIGEEGYSDADRQYLRSGADVLVVDPLDGTRAFATGDERFSMLVCQCSGGQPVAAWMYFPARDVLVEGHIDRGVTINGRSTRVTAGGAERLRLTWLQDGDRARVERQLTAAGWCDTAPTSTEFLNLVSGETSQYLCSHTTPWDTAPGVLLARAAGGWVERCEGEAWSVGDEAGLLLFSPNEETWTETRRAHELRAVRPCRSPLEVS